VRLLLSFYLIKADIFLVLNYFFLLSFFFLLSQKKEEETYECFAFCKKKKESPWAGERLQANMGIFCVSRIFVVTRTYVRTN